MIILKTLVLLTAISLLINLILQFFGKKEAIYYVKFIERKFTKSERIFIIVILFLLIRFL